MERFLRQSTASQGRTVGPFVDDTDFKTAETGLTIANTDVKLMANGGSSANKNSGGGTHRVNGMYALTFDATDTATVGELQVSIVVAGALPVWTTFWVLEEAIYDALFAASATGALPVSGTVTVGTNSDKTGYSLSSTQTFSVTGNITGNVSGSVGSVTGAVGSVTGNVGGTVNGLTSTAQGHVRTAVGLASANTDTQLSAIDTVVDAIKVTTDKLDGLMENASGYRFTEKALEEAPTGGGGGGGDATEAKQDQIIALIGTPVTDVSTDLAAVKAQTAAIEADTQDLQTQIGTNGAGLTAIGDTRMGNLDATVSSRLASSGYTAPPSAATNAGAVRTELATELGRIDASVSTRATASSVSALPSASDIATAVLNAATSTPIKADLDKINGTDLTGNGSSGTPWGPA